MKTSKFKRYLILLALGFLLIALDVDVSTSWKYPHEYANSDKVIGEFQYYNIASNYHARCTYKMIESSKGSENRDSLSSNPGISQNVVQSTVKVIDKIYFQNIRVDIASDLLGFVLIVIACFGLRRISRRFRFAAVTSVISFVLHSVVLALPFFVNGLPLCNLAMALGFTYLLCSVLTVFLFVSGLLGMCPGVICRDERKWCKTLWFLTFVLQILVTFVFWLGSDFRSLHNLGTLLEWILVILIIAFWVVLNRTYEYMEETYNRKLSA